MVREECSGLGETTDSVDLGTKSLYCRRWTEFKWEETPSLLVLAGVAAVSCLVTACVPLSLPLLAAGAATQVAVRGLTNHADQTDTTSLKGTETPTHSQPQVPADKDPRQLPDHCRRVEGGTICTVE